MTFLRDPIWQFIGVAVSIFLFVVSMIMQYIPIPFMFNNHLLNSTFTIISPFTFLGLAVIVSWAENRKLRQHIHDGMKYTKNHVKVTVDVQQQIYRFSFEKHFTIISNEKPKWYKSQFYCNRYLGNSEQTRKYYAENTPEWEQLKVFANLKYRRPGEQTFSDPVRLKIIPITNRSYYIPFHIHYESISGSKIPMEKGTKVILNYGYEVSAKLWGSYLNRTLDLLQKYAIIDE